MAGRENWGTGPEKIPRKGPKHAFGCVAVRKRGPLKAFTKKEGRHEKEE